MHKLNQNLFEITYDPKIEFCRLAYKAYVKSDEFRQINQYSLEVIGDRPLKCMMRDMRLLSNISNSDREWFKAEIVPELLAKGLKCMAIIVPVAKTAHSFFKDFFDSALPETVITQYFHNQNDAQQWLSMMQD